MSVRICVLDLSCVSPDKCADLGFGEAERQRLERIKNPTRRLESEAGLIALKKALAHRAFCDVVRDGYGKPRFERDVGLDFNISHSGRLSVAAVCDEDEGRIGVDIELAKSQEKTEKLFRIADRYFKETEKEIFDETKNVLDFYRLWTVKEAEAKLIGIGLSEMLGIKKECQGTFDTHSFVVEHSGKKYILSVCTENETSREIEFVFDGDISIVPFEKIVDVVV